MKDILLTTLRDAKTPIELFRKSADQLASALAVESGQFFTKIKKPVQTPMGETSGIYAQEKPYLAPILRSGLALLPSFLRSYPEAPVGHIGIRRDEKTALPCPYYSHLPSIASNHLIFLLEPMIATGQTACAAVDILQRAGAQLSQIVLISLLAASEGISYFSNRCSAVRVHVVQVDPTLDPKKWIVPGLGDFGDRYFGT